MLAIKDLSVGYGDTKVLWDINLEIAPGEIVALIGVNGAGKTTLLKTLMGLLPPWTGSIRYRGQELSRLDTHRIVKLGINLTPQGRLLFTGMSVEENLLMGAYLRRDSEVKHDLKHIYDLFPRLSERKRQRAGTLSGGEQQMCALGRSLMSRPSLLLLDEMSLGLAPIVVEMLLDLVVEIRGQGTTVLLVEQDIEEALLRADRGYVLEGGRMEMSGPSPDLLSNASLRVAYLGLA
ncbi:Putative ABC transporter [Acididesulfobacillus acetoxydans]|uniref:ABC transporter n=1 Tax=Acididesulfobacillus acetoxydans TaxID=1561005 RepID=A0A8S0WXY0_9FIRM|nr:ABC transporter ATP-binding protein [Acididesulfobacillus acetoxydans]CAA7601191.1 Putative ABC transporter [Acididesulfobacillus acetoxydans]CEJ08530.1 High-affinity branched-chain amino acid transport ATP-binding protein LivF [Acididesulfobacillus acetoxydans]